MPFSMLLLPNILLSSSFFLLNDKYFNKCLFDLYHKEIKTGVFGADMKVALVNDGPFTMIYDSKELIKND